MTQPIFALDPAGYRPHALHAGTRNWPETNCYVDLWIEVLASLGLPPEAMLGFTLTQDFEGDQFTFFKMPLEDLETLYGVRVTELSIFDRLEAHVAEQLARERLVLVEMDAFFLPDTRGVSYRSQHTKTTVAIASLDPAARRMTYFHNAGFFELAADDYDGLFGLAGQERAPAQLFPYVEFVKLGSAPSAGDRVSRAVRLLRHHFTRRPSENPIGAFARRLPLHIADLASRPPEYFHVYAFNTLRQLGANFELLASHLDWLGSQGIGGLEDARTAATRIGEGAKPLQFKLARAMARRRFDDLVEPLQPLASAWDDLMASLETALRAEPRMRPARAAA